MEGRLSVSCPQGHGLVQAIPVVPPLGAGRHKAFSIVGLRLWLQSHFVYWGEKVPEVTAIKAQRRRKDRANVYLDGEYAFSLQKMLAAQLVVGQQLSSQEREALEAQDVVERAHERALHYLTYRPRSAQEVQRYLERKQVPPEVISQVVERLKRARLLDDAAFAEFWIENRETFRPRGAWALSSELRQKGVAPDVIQAALADLDEEDSAHRAGEQALRRYARLDHDTFFRRMMGYLQRRGFGYGISRRVAEHCWDELQAQQSAEGNSDSR